MFLLAQDATGIGIPSGPAWAVGIAIVLWAATGIIAKILELRWNAGSKARIEEMAAEAQLKKADAEHKIAEAKLAQADIDEVVSAYEEKLKEVVKDCERNVENMRVKMQAHIDIIDKKLDASEDRERNCIQELSIVKGRLQILEELQGIKAKIAENSNDIAGMRAQSAIPPIAIVPVPITGTIKDPETKEITGNIKMDEPKQQ